VTAGRDLAVQARELAAAAPRGSMARRAYGCAAVALAETKTLAHARRILAEWHGPADVVTAALTALDQLTRPAAAA
jgi:hypothetical protein